MKKKILAILMTALMVVSLIPMFAFTALAATTWSDVTGTGTKADPYCISTREGLTELANKVNSGETFIGTYFKLTANIVNFSTPIGNSTYNFQGNFDGMNHTVTLSMGENQEHYAGLFGYTKSAEIKNVNTDGTVRGKCVGGISGWSDSGTIINCHNSASIKLVDGNVLAGGICGGTTGIIKNCYNEGSVKGNTSDNNRHIGGISGRTNGQIINSYNCGEIPINDECYPIFYTNNGQATVFNCYYNKNVYTQTIEETKGIGLTTEKMKADTGTDGALIDLLNGYKESGTYPADFARWIKADGAHYPTLATFHDLKVTKNGEAAVEGTDYEWDYDEVTILTNGLTVSGTTTRENIVTVSDVTDLTIEDLSITIVNGNYNAVLFSNNYKGVKLTLVGTNNIIMGENNAIGLSFFSGNNIITGDGNLTASCNEGIAISVSGEGNLTIEKGVGEILVRGSDNTYGAIYCDGNLTYDKELLVKGSKAFGAKETEINSDIEIKDKCAKIDDDVAKAVLIQAIKKYDVTVSSEIKNGKVKVDKEKAIEGETVTLTVTPNECYKLASLKVTDAGGEEVTVTDNKFEMPASNVTVTAEFKTVKYKMTKGEKQEIDLTDVKDAVFASEADYYKFKSVKVDDKTVDSKNYTVKSGSTVVTLKADYLKTLKVGKHEIKILSEDGIASAEFTVKEATPKTADANNMLLWIVLALAALGLAAGTILKVKKTNK